MSSSSQRREGDDPTDDGGGVTGPPPSSSPPQALSEALRPFVVARALPAVGPESSAVAETAEDGAGGAVAALVAAYGADVAYLLAVMRERRERGGYADDRAPHLNAHRLAFARWLIEQGKLTEE